MVQHKHFLLAKNTLHKGPLISMQFIRFKISIYFGVQKHAQNSSQDPRQEFVSLGLNIESQGKP